MIYGYIKDYDGGILMECKIDPKLPYTDLSTMIRCQRLKEADIPKKLIKVEDIPGLREAGWTADQYGHSRFGPNFSPSSDSAKKHLTAFMRSVLKTLGVLTLQRNNLGRPIPDTFPLNCNLRTLDLNGNLLTKRTPQSLASCRALEVFDLGNNEMLYTFPLFLKNFSTLQVLFLRSNKLYGHITCEKSIGAWLVIQIEM
ncbi:hypothetical protein FNV43_RR08813 [Rhamnella rubrinervis]|uniref:Uncharacterized protein n=1 Tax=Rhamnella rubrinervis TaxID=2594499 RepID=A0A8K0MJL8_9ROSA|nr:hypothetical protein FNV43_RR08813 [Rhamnella rubrinervis]